MGRTPSVITHEGLAVLQRMHRRRLEQATDEKPFRLPAANRRIHTDTSGEQIVITLTVDSHNVWKSKPLGIVFAQYVIHTLDAIAELAVTDQLKPYTVAGWWGSRWEGFWAGNLQRVGKEHTDEPEPEAGAFGWGGTNGK